MTKIFIALITTIVFSVAACTNAANPVNISRVPTPAPQQRPGVDSDGHTDGQDAPRISLADAKKAFDDKTAVFIDTHVKSTYDYEHIPGAINITMQDLEAKFNTIPKGKKIIAYCSWANEHTSASLVAELHKKGLTNSYALLGGTKAWRDAGYPMEKSK